MTKRDGARVKVLKVDTWSCIAKASITGNAVQMGAIRRNKCRVFASASPFIEVGYRHEQNWAETEHTRKVTDSSPVSALYLNRKQCYCSKTYTDPVDGHWWTFWPAEGLVTTLVRTFRLWAGGSTAGGLRLRV